MSFLGPSLRGVLDVRSAMDLHSSAQISYRSKPTTCYQYEKEEDRIIILLTHLYGVRIQCIHVC